MEAIKKTRRTAAPRSKVVTRSRGRRSVQSPQTPPAVAAMPERRDDDVEVEPEEDARVVILPVPAPRRRALSPLVVVRQPPIPARRKKVATAEQPEATPTAPTREEMVTPPVEELSVSSEEAGSSTEMIDQPPSDQSPVRRVELRQPSGAAPTSPPAEVRPPTPLEAAMASDQLMREMRRMLERECHRYELMAESSSGSRGAWGDAADKLRRLRMHLAEEMNDSRERSRREPHCTPPPHRASDRYRASPTRRTSPVRHVSPYAADQHSSRYLASPRRVSPSPAPSRRVSPYRAYPTDRHRSPLARSSPVRHRLHDDRVQPPLTPLLSAAARAVQRAHEPEGDYYTRLARRVEMPVRLPASVSATATATSGAMEERVSVSDLREVINLHRAPPLKLGTFGGNVLHYPAFMASLRNCLEASVQPGQGLVPRLLEVLVGEAREVVGEVQLLPDGEGYALAKERLEKRYGQPSQLADRWRHKLSSFSSNSCRAWANKLLACVDALSATGTIDRMGRGQELQSILQRVPDKARNAFADLDNKARLRQRLQPGLIDLLDILEEQMRKEEAREAYRPSKRARDDDGDARDHKRRRGPEQNRAVMAVDASDTDNCTVCKQGRHSIVECTRFGMMSVPERRSEIRKARLCFACLGAGHRVAECDEVCGYCRGRHHVTIHEDRSTSGPTAIKSSAPPTKNNQPNKKPGKSEKGGNNKPDKQTDSKGASQAGFRRRQKKRAQRNNGNAANVQTVAPANN